MANDNVLAYLQDILDAISDVEQFFVDYPKRFDVFEKDYLRRSAVERKAEIMGEAMNRIRKADPNVIIPNARAIIETRNRIIHAYDNVQPEFLWGLVIRHIPELKNDIQRILSEYEDRLYREN
ncbi:MAG: DUF86 domain-containing protein [Muribaculaceae bacterium]|nr:DUF86 domain-containing protein [Muribaculaceae bacterium]